MRDWCRRNCTAGHLLMGYLHEGLETGQIFTIRVSVDPKPLEFYSAVDHDAERPLIR